MASGIPGPPNTYDFGLAFNYSVWTAGTEISLVNVPWNNDYRDIYKPANDTALDAYIDGLESAGITINNMSYVKVGEPVRIDAPFNKVYKYNYLRAKNPMQPVGGDEARTYYYFILDVRYLAPNTTELVLQLDVWQTFGPYVTFGQCYVERGHLGIANENQMQNYGRNYLTVPEGLDAGSDLRIIDRNYDGVIDQRIVLVASTVDLTADPGTVDAPNLVSATGGAFYGTVSGASMYVFTNTATFQAWLNSMKDKPWVTQGIISATIIPTPSKFGLADPGGNGPQVPAIGSPSPRYVNLHTNFRGKIVSNLPPRYSGLKKFQVSPYSGVELSTMMGNAVNCKPELVNNPNFEVVELVALAGPNQKLSAYPRYYNSLEDGASLAGAGEETAFASHMANFPTMAVVNNMAINYMASNKNAILHAGESADWSQQRALGMAQGQYDIGVGAMHSQMSNAGSQGNADIAQTANVNRTLAAQAVADASAAALAGIGNALTPAGLLGSAISGVAQAANTGVNAGIQTAANDEALAIRNQALGETTITNNKQMQLVNDTNKRLADWAAKGDYANAIGAINAKVQDARMIQPSISGQMGGDQLNMVNGLFQVRASIKLIDEAAIRVIGEFWLRYGYAVRAFYQMPASLQVMTTFTYWKLTETYLSAATVPEQFKQVIRGIFEKGVTVWNNPAQIGKVDIAANGPLAGVSY